MELERAKQIVLSLADGVDPFNGALLPPDSVYNNAEVVRALYTVLGYSTAKKQGKRKQKFYLSEAQKRQYTFSPLPISVSEIVKQCNVLADLENCKKLTYTSVVNWLLEIGALVMEGNKKRPTAEGEALGIKEDHRMGKNGPYTVITHDQGAQQFILDHLDAIVSITASNRPSERK